MSTKPKKERGSRITLRGVRNPLKKGRPKGTKKKHKFEETKLGFMLKYETPLEYNLIMNASSNSPFPVPDVDIIELITNASDNDSFSKPKFKRYLNEYRENGIVCSRAKILTPERKLFYDRVRKSKIKNFTKGRKSELKRTLLINKK